MILNTGDCASWWTRPLPGRVVREWPNTLARALIVPDTQFGITARNLMTRSLPDRLVARFGTEDMTQDLDLPDYPKLR